MTFEEGMYAYLSADADITAIVDDRIYPKRLPEGVDLPAISWFRASAERIYTYDTFEETDAWVKARVQFNCWARDDEALGLVGADVADQLGNAVLARMSGFEGDMGGVPIGSSMTVNEIDEYDVPAKFYRRIIDIMVSYQEDVKEESS